MIAALARAVDTLVERLWVEPRFTPRRVDEQVRWLEDARVTLATLSEVELFPAPTRANMDVQDAGRYHGVKAQNLLWDLPRLPAIELFGLRPRTGSPRATWLGVGGRPIWVLIDGWMGGTRLMNEIFWPIRRLLRTYDVALLVLPGHGGRTEPHDSVLPTFPNRNPIRNVLGLLTAVTELRELVAWLRERGYSQIGVAGSSLGAHSSALLSTLENDVTRWLFDRPMVDLGRPLRQRVERDRADLLELLDTLSAFYLPVSPLGRAGRALPGRLDVLLGREDHLAGLAEGRALAHHLGVMPEIYPTGHVFSLGREAKALALMAKLGGAPAKEPPG